jgi:hypothetical protein
MRPDSSSNAAGDVVFMIGDLLGGYSVFAGLHNNSDKLIKLYLSDDAFTPAAITEIGSWTATPASPQWNHYAIVRSGSNFYGFVNGQLYDSSSWAGSVVAFGATVYIGRDYTLSGPHYYGHIDELRVSKGIARWTSDFTPPTQAYGAGGSGSMGYSPVKLGAGGKITLSGGKVKLK